ncbi:MAG: oxidoreductase [Rhodospirillales bacterium]|nr:oxidoreductase [Rhodospirillales bacterium]
MLLEDKVVIITGVGPGMGRKLALVAAEEGAKVAICSRTQAFIDEVANEVRAAGGEAIAVATDVADMAQCKRLADATLDAFGRIDGLVNSAYKRASFGTFEENDIEQWQDSMNVTCFGALRMIKAVLPAMKQRHAGAIVNVLTLAAVKPFAGEADYATAKGALGTATRVLAEELGKYNIRVNATRMGWLWGHSVKNWVRMQSEADGVPEQQVIDQIANRIPLKVIPPDEECAKSVLFFVSDYSKMATGGLLDVNGGEYMTP